MKCVYTIPVMVIFMYQLGMSRKGQENTGSIDFGVTNNFQWVGKFANIESVNNNEDWLHPTCSVSVVDIISFKNMYKKQYLCKMRGENRLFQHKNNAKIQW